MTSEDIRREIERDPSLPLRLHLSGGKHIDLPYAGPAWVRQTSLLVVYPLGPDTRRIENFDVIELQSINRVETVQA